MFPGNLKYIDTPYNKNKKVAHKLSTTTGRGESYPGYIVNIPIKKEYVKKSEMYWKRQKNIIWIICCVKSKGGIDVQGLYGFFEIFGKYT